MSDWLKGLIDAEEDYAKVGRVECRAIALYNTTAMMNHEYSDGYFSYTTNKHNREMDEHDIEMREIRGKAK